MSAIKMKRVLTTPALIAFGLAYMVPLGIFTTYGQVTITSDGHLPIAYIITLAMILFTALSYCRMANKFPIAGSAYSYVVHTFGNRIGFLIGWTQILDYLFLPILNYLVIGIYLHQRFPEIPAYVFVLGSLVTVSTLNYLGIKLINSVNFLLIFVQFIFITLFVVLAFTNVDLNTEALLRPLVFTTNDISGLFSGAAVLCLAFLGFDAIATLAEESTNAKNSLPKAILWTVIIAGGIFLVISYAAHLAYPVWQNFANEPDTASLVVIGKVGEISKIGSTFMVNFFLAAYLTGVLASAMTAQTSVSRIFFAMGREGVLPKKIFYRLHKRFHTPHLAILFVATFSLFSLIITLDLVVSMISFGALMSFTFVNLCVIKSYLYKRKSLTAITILKFGILPAIGVLLSLWLWTSLDHMAITIGLIWFGVGIIYLLILTRMLTKPIPSLSDDEVKALIT
ncbi:amino acid/polyamine/organocation transporter (APC superfamily) [Frischella perrara]|uniref:Amino acid/polyamine/organocation transporter, APC superfamily n=1 Tax=Frischella perrara TaxID=1267021 RepID=A0A0A7RZS0_FRIPE|nr:APC family permease [Frischella perrara]AJA44728.1 amino acid/polyamine/organocation transporter, APC superfamily [Frischella perrara]PWV64950.1 amino acid/polyamine/organocation transporter (APC superfamily) [Frischella perrara]